LGKLRDCVIKEKIKSVCLSNDLNFQTVEEVAKVFSTHFYAAITKNWNSEKIDYLEDSKVFKCEFKHERNIFDFKYFITRQLQKFGISVDPNKIPVYISVAIHVIKLKDEDISSIQYTFDEKDESIHFTVEIHNIN
jgi:hypothetical protein